MRRGFRLVHKKRGHRHSVSPMAGHLGELVFFGIVFLIGLVWMAAALVFLVTPLWRANTRFVETVCEIENKRVVVTDDPDETRFRPEFLLRFEVEGRSQAHWGYSVCRVISTNRAEQEAILEGYEVGQTYPCWYDPSDPTRVVLVREFGWFAMMMVLGALPFVLIGGGGVLFVLLRFGKSDEHVLATWRKGNWDRVVKKQAESNRLPGVPQGADMTNSPGTTLAYRLPISASPTWKLVGILLAALLWNAAVAYFTTIAVRGFLLGQPDWWVTIFLVPFVALGIFFIFLFFRQLLIATGVGKTFLEISDHPLHPGQICRVLVHQSGRLRVRSLKLFLVCREKTQFREGTDTRIETKTVFSQEIFRRQRFDIQRGIPFEAEVEMAVPQGVMHSFRSANNEIQWLLVVEGKLTRKPNFQREFYLIVHPEKEHDESRGAEAVRAEELRGGE